MYRVKIVLRDERCKPEKAHESDVGYDLRSMNDYEVRGGSQVLIDTGINIKLPHEQGWIWEAQIRPRSGLALKKQLTITNTPGTIDENYTGNIGVILRNLGEDTYYIKKYDKVAQMVITRVPYVSIQIVQALEQTDRGNGGFGSSGK